MMMMMMMMMMIMTDNQPHVRPTKNHDQISSGMYGPTVL
jgi:hypothetical protein